MKPDEYVALLEERRDEWTAEHGATRFPPLLEWFIRPGDEHLFTPELDRIDAHLATLDPGTRHGTTDPAAYGGIGIRQTARQQRAWGERIDRTAAEYVRLTRRRDEVAAKLARAEKREAKTASEELATSGLTCDNEDVSDPREAGTSGGLAGTYVGGPTG